MWVEYAKRYTPKERIEKDKGIRKEYSEHELNMENILRFEDKYPEGLIIPEYIRKVGDYCREHNIWHEWTMADIYKKGLLWKIEKHKGETVYVSVLDIKTEEKKKDIQKNPF